MIGAQKDVAKQQWTLKRDVKHFDDCNSGRCSHATRKSLVLHKAYAVPRFPTYGGGLDWAGAQALRCLDYDHDATGKLWRDPSKACVRLYLIAILYIPLFKVYESVLTHLSPYNSKLRSTILNGIIIILPVQ